MYVLLYIAPFTVLSGTTCILPDLCVKSVNSCCLKPYPRAAHSACNSPACGYLAVEKLRLSDAVQPYGHGRRVLLAVLRLQRKNINHTSDPNGSPIIKSSPAAFSDTIPHKPASYRPNDSRSLFRSRTFLSDIPGAMVSTGIETGCISWYTLGRTQYLSFRTHWYVENGINEDNGQILMDHSQIPYRHFRMTTRGKHPTTLILK